MNLRVEEEHYKDGAIRNRRYYLWGERHRDDGPADEGFYLNGNIKYRNYYIQGALHRLDGPAYEYFYENSNIERRGYYVHNKRHRDDGPAQECFYPNGNIQYREEPSNPQDSGWRFFCGDETQAYTDNPDNIAIYGIDTILVIDKSIISHLGAAQGAVFERKYEDSLFIIPRPAGKLHS